MDEYVYDLGCLVLVENSPKRVGKDVLLTLILWLYLFDFILLLLCNVYVCHTFYFQLVLFSVYVYVFLQIYIVGIDKIIIFNHYDS